MVPDHKPWLVLQGKPGQFYIDHTHPFGASSASSNSGMIANAVVHIWWSLGVKPMVKYKDDLAIFRVPHTGASYADPNGHSYLYDRASMLDSISSLHVPWHPDKGSPCFESLFTFIGLSWDLVRKTVALPCHKRLKYLLRTQSFLDRFRVSRCQLKDVERLHGTLCYASFVYTDGRSRLPSLSNFAATFHGDVHIKYFPTHALMSDLRWWATRLSDLSFSRPIIPPALISPLSIYVDASTSWGLGLVVDSRWMAFRLSDSWKIPGRDITWLETVAVELVAYILDEFDVHDTRLEIHSDNQGTIGAMWKGRSPNYHINMSIRRAFAVLTPRCIFPSLSYVESAKNPADPISRGSLGPDVARIPLRLRIPEILSRVFTQC